MPQFLLTVMRPDDFDPGTAVDAEMRDDIQALNDEMRAAGIRVFVGGLKAPGETRSLVSGPDGTVTASDGPLYPSGSHIDGLWVLELPDLDTAVDWGRRSARACRAQVEVRPFH